MKKFLAMLLCVLLAAGQVTGAFAAVALPSSLQVIEDGAFAGDTSVTGVVTLPGSVTDIGSEAFAGTNLFALRTSTNVRNIGSNVLAGTDAVYALVPSYFATLEEDALTGVMHIITTSGSPVQYWAEEHGIPVYATTDVNIHDGFYYAYLNDMSEVTLLFPVSDSISGDITIPAFVDGRPVVEISATAFTRLSGVTSISVPDTAALPENRVNWPSCEINTYSTHTDEPFIPSAEDFGSVRECGINYTSVIMNPGEELRLILDDCESDKGWMIEQTNTGVLSCVGSNDYSVVFAAEDLGTTTVTLTRIDSNGTACYGLCEVTVVEPEVHLNVAAESILMTLGEVNGLVYNFTTSGMSDEVNYTLTSSDESVVTVFSNEGGLEAVGIGEADVTFTIEQYGATDSATVHVKVVENELTFEVNEFNGYVGYSYQAVLLDEIPEDAVVEWYSPLEDLVSVDENGLITCHSSGSTYCNSVYITCTVTYADGTVKSGYVIMYVLDIDMTIYGPDELTIRSGEEWWLDVVIDQHYWTDDRDEFSFTGVSSDESILTFVNERTDHWCVYAHKPGTVTVTVTAEFLGVSETRELTIIVEAPYMQAYVDTESIEFLVGEQWGLGYWFESETSVTETLSSSDPSVATVSSTGLITAVGPGTAEITYTVSGAGVSSSATATVTIYGISASFPQEEYTISVGESITLVPQIDLPEGVYTNFNDYYFGTSDDVIASVDQYGSVIGKAAGTVTIKFAVDLDFFEGCEWAHAYATAVVHVVDPDAMITLSDSSLEFLPGETKTVTATFAKQPESVSWWSSNFTAYDVEDGVITANSNLSYPSYDLIICTAVIDGETYEARLQVSCAQSNASFNGGRSWMGMNVGDEDSLYFNWTSIVAEGFDASSLHIQAESEDESVVSVEVLNSHELRLVGASEGTANVITSLCDGSGNVYGYWITEIFVGTCPQPSDIVFEYDSYAVTPEDGSDNYRWVNLNGETVYYYPYDFTVSDPSVLEPGWCEFWGRNEGVTTYTATNTDYPQYTASTTVYVQEWRLTADKTELGIGDTITVTVENYPEAVPYERINWGFDEWMFTEISRDDYSITLRANCLGQSEINCDIYMGERGYWTNRSVYPSVTGDYDYRMNWSNVSACPGENFGFHPEYGEINWSSLTWESTDQTIATVNTEGVVFAHAVGSCQIICHLPFSDGTVIDAVCYLTVNEPEWTLVEIGMPDMIYTGSEYGVWPYFERSGLWDPEYTITISDESVLAYEPGCEENGWSNILRAVAPGVVTITVTASDDEKTETVSQTLRVIEPAVRFEHSDYELFVGYSIEPALIPASGKEIASVVWTSHDEGALIPDANGLFTTLGPVTCVLISADVTFTDGTAASASSVVHIRDASELWLNNVNMNVPDSNLFTEEGYGPPSSSYAYLDIDTNAPDNMIDIVWAVDDPSVASIAADLTSDESGRIALVEALAGGETRITATVTVGELGSMTAEGYINVQEPVLNAYFYDDELTMSIGDMTWPNFNGESNFGGAVTTWATSDFNIVDVDATGTLYALAPGSAVITATNAYGDKSASDTITIHVEGVDAYMSPESLCINVGESASVIPHYVLPEDVVVYNSHFYSTNDSVVFVDEFGRVYARAAGSAEIFFEAELNTGRIKCSTFVQIEDPDAPVSLGSSYVLLTPGESYQFEPTFNGIDPDSVIWHSDNECFFWFEENGLLRSDTGNHAHNQANITCTAVCGDTEYVAHAYVLSTGPYVQINGLDPWYDMRTNQIRDYYIWWSCSAEAGQFDWEIEITGDENVITAERTDDHNLRVTGVGPGKAVITLRVVDQDGFVYYTTSADYWCDYQIDPVAISYEFETYAAHTQNHRDSNFIGFNILPEDMSKFFYISAASGDPNVLEASHAHGACGREEGVTTYTATVADYPQYTASTTVYVQDWYLEADKTDLAVGDIFTVSVKNYPTAVPYEWINWQYDDWAFAEVSRDEYSITLASRTNGTRDISCEISMGSRGYHAYETATVTATTPNDEYVFIDQPFVELNVGEVMHYSIDGNIESMVLTSSDDSVAYIQYEREIVGAGLGECTVTAAITFYSGATAEYAIPVSVVEPYFTVREIVYEGPFYVGDVYSPNTDWDYSGFEEPTVTNVSSDPAVLSFDSPQIWHFTANSAGTATISSTVTKGNTSYTFEQTVTVIEPAVRFAECEYRIYEGTSSQLALIAAEGKTIESVVWRSLDPSIAAVDDNGLVTGVTSDSRCLVCATVTFTDETSASAACWVRVENLGNINLNYDINCNRIELSTQWYGAYPQTMSNRIHFHDNLPMDLISVTWTIDDPSVAALTTDANDPCLAHFEAIAPGSTAAHVCIQLIVDGSVLEERSFDFSVDVYEASFSMNAQETAFISMDETHWLDWGIAEERVYWPHEYQYISSDESVVLPTVHHHVVSVNPGTATVTCIVRVHGEEIARDSVDITVWGPDIAATESITLAAGETGKVNGAAGAAYWTSTVSNEDDRDIVIYDTYWQSVDENIAIVSPEGDVYAVHPGKTTLQYYVDTNYGHFFAYCDVTVTGTADFTLNETHLELYPFDTFRLEYSSAIGTPESVKWSVSGDTGEIAVDENGLVSINDCDRPKTAVVTCTAVINGKEYFASCEVDVLIQTVASSSLFGDSNAWMRIGVGQTIEIEEGINCAGDDAYSVSFSSDDPSVAYVDENNVICGASAGETTLYMTITSDNGEVNVRRLYVYVDLEEPALETIVPVHTSYVIGAEGYQDWNRTPIDFETVPIHINSDAVFTSANEGIVVMEDSMIHGMYPGQTTVTITSTKNPDINIPIRVSVVGNAEFKPTVSGPYRPGDIIPFYFEGQTWEDEDVAYFHCDTYDYTIANYASRSWVDEDMNLHVGTEDGSVKLEGSIGFVNGYDFNFVTYIEVDNSNGLLYAPYYCDYSSNVLNANVGDAVLTWLNAYDNAEVTSPSYKSDDTDIASVVFASDDYNSVITCNKLGTTRVHVQTTHPVTGNTLNGTLVVNVIEPEQPVFTIEGDPRIIKVGETGRFWLQQENTNTRRPASVVTMSDETIATATYDVDTDHWVIEGLKPGVVEMTVSGTYGGLTTTHTYPVCIIANE